MTSLLALREKLKGIYGKYDIYMNPVMKFLFTMLALLLVNGQIGYMDRVKNPLIVIVLCGICAILPNAVIVFVITMVILAHLYALSIETFVVAGITFLLIYLLYFRFTANSSIWVVITMLMCFLKLPYAVPVLAGLAGGAFTAVPVCFGVVIHSIIQFSAQYSVAITASTGESDFMQKFAFVIDGFFSDGVLLMVLSFTITIVLVAIIKKLAIDYAWLYAIIAGTLTNFIVLLVGNIIFSAGFHIVGIILNAIFGMVVGYLLDLLLFSADYSRTERVSYEDEDYYYFVKAVPKSSVPVAEVKVKKINTQKVVRKPSHNEDIDIDID